MLGSIEKENYNDDTLGEHIRQPEIRNILLRYGLDVEKISKPGEGSNYPLLERTLPDLCADRIDYALREGIYWYLPEAKRYLDYLMVHDHEFIFSSRIEAKSFGEHYLKCYREYWGSAEWRIRYYFLSKALKEAMKDGMIGMKDLYLKEEELIGKMRKEGTAEENRCILLALGNFSFEVNDTGDIFLGKMKKRYVDPKFIEEGKVRRLSEVDEAFKKQIKVESERNTEMRVQILPNAQQQG